jgi:uncharacterized protein YndB with AHSA1/START domain
MEGAIKVIPGGKIIVFERHLKHAPEVVWKAITDPAQIKQWLTVEAAIEHFEGGKVELKWDNGDMVTGVVTTYHPFQQLAYTWKEESSGDSELSFYLTSNELGTLLTLEHTFYRTDDLANFLSGWHVHLDVLAFTMQGKSFGFPWERQKELRIMYRDKILNGCH